MYGEVVVSLIRAAQHNAGDGDHLVGARIGIVHRAPGIVQVNGDGIALNHVGHRTAGEADLEVILRIGAAGGSDAGNGDFLRRAGRVQAHLVSVSTQHVLERGVAVNGGDVVTVILLGRDAQAGDGDFLLVNGHLNGLFRGITVLLIALDKVIHGVVTGLGSLGKCGAVVTIIQLVL